MGCVAGWPDKAASSWTWAMCWRATRLQCWGMQLMMLDNVYNYVLHSCDAIRSTDLKLHSKCHMCTGLLACTPSYQLRCDTVLMKCTNAWLKARCHRSSGSHAGAVGCSPAAHQRGAAAAATCCRLAHARMPPWCPRFPSQQRGPRRKSSSNLRTATPCSGGSWIRSLWTLRHTR